MRVLTASDLVRTFEALQDQNPLEQALTLLHAAFPESDRETLANLTVSERDAWLLELREQTLGPKLEGRADCPSCGASLEFAVRTKDLGTTGEAGAGSYAFEKGDLRVQLRMPRSRDLFDVINLPEEEGRRALARQCIVNTENVDFDSLPDELIEEAARKLCENEPMAESLVNLDCPVCGHSWQLLLDIGCFLAKEIETLARRLLLEVHVLASAYGWTEREVFTLSPRRRQAYLELVGYA
jgi:hypothetical protein